MQKVLQFRKDPVIFLGMMSWFTCFLLFVMPLRMHAQNFEGVLGKAADLRPARMRIVDIFLPYNPFIVEIGGYEGENTNTLATTHPLGRVIVFEPNPRAFKKLLENTQQCSNVSAFNMAIHARNGLAQLHLSHWLHDVPCKLENASSLLIDPLYRHLYVDGPVIEVPCANLDDWCQRNQIDHIDFIHLDIEGLELEVLKSSFKILTTVSVMLITTNLAPFRIGTVLYADLKNHLEQVGFELVSHWYHQGLQGEAIFIRKTIYDAVFK